MQYNFGNFVALFQKGVISSMTRKIKRSAVNLPSACFPDRGYKRSFFTLILLFICLSSCSQSDHHNFNKPGKIPIDGRRWYILNNASSGFEQLFNGKQFEHINTGYGTVLDNFDAYYRLEDGEQMTIDSMMMFDWEGTNPDHPMTLYAVTADWKRIPIAVFTGARYNAWNGPDPAKPDIYVLKNPISDIRYLVINSWGDLPGEIELYGSYKKPAPVPPVAKNYYPLSNYFGVNAFEWDFEAPEDPAKLNEKRLSAIGNFTGIRHYLDWEKIEAKEGVYTFAPASTGGWNYDTMYQWCYDQHIELLACVKACPQWLLDSYPADQRDNENIPMRYGRDPKEPASYLEQAKMGFQFAARYGRNRNVDRQLITVDKDNIPRSGLGTVRYIECDNERDKWWKGRKGYQTGREYAANLSAFYDGNKQKLGKGAGVKNADSTMRVVMGGLATPSTDYLQGMIDWCREFRGYKPNGDIDLPWDVINYHYYCNDADYDNSKKQTSGVAPEMTRASVIAGQFTQLAHQQAHGMPVWVTEAGYDVNNESPQKAPKINGRSALEVQADWLLRTSLLYSRLGIQRVFYYELIDDNPKLGSQYSTSGLINTDRSARPVADYFRQVNTMFGGYSFVRTISNNPIVDEYRSGGQTMYMLVVPGKGGVVKYTLDLGSDPAAVVYGPKYGSVQMDTEKRTAISGKIELEVSGSPLFVVPSSVR